MNAAAALAVLQIVGATADVRDVAEHGGRIVCATDGGLVVVDGGRVVETRTTQDGLPGARLRSVSATEEGLWVGAVEGAALVRWTEGFRIERKLDLRRVTRVAEWRGVTYLATHGDGLHRLARDGRTEKVSLGRAAPYDRLTDLLGGDELWIATAGAGVVRLAADGTVAGRHLPGAIVWDLAADGDRVLAATLGGVESIEAGRSRPLAAAAKLPVRDVRSIAVDRGDVVVATFGGGAWRLGERPARIGSAARTRTVSVVGTALVVAHDAGLDVAGRPVPMGGLPSADVTALAEGFGALWVGTFDRGLVRIAGGRVEPVTRATERFGVDRRVNDLAFAGGRLWIATDRGLFRHDGRTFSPVEDSEGPGRTHVTSLFADAHGDLWVTSSRRLSRLRAGQWSSWTGEQLHAVTTDSRGRVWVGSLHGLLRLDEATGRFERHGVSTRALPVDWVTAVLPWADGVVAGTYHGGLSFFDGRAFRIEREGPSGIPAGWVNPHAMRRIGGALWVGTLDRGLVVGRPGAWTRLTTADGLPSNDVTAVLPADDGTVWVATRAGLARVGTAERGREVPSSVRRPT